MMNKKIHRLASRFFEDFDSEPEFQQFVQKIIDITNGDLIKRLDKLEKKVFKKMGMPANCDAPGCSKTPIFQCGARSSDKRIGSWCSNEHFDKFSL